MFGRSFLSLRAPPLGRLTIPLLCTVNATTASSTTTVRDRWSSYDSLHQVILRKVEQQDNEQVEVSEQRGARAPALDSPNERTSPSSTSLATVLVPSGDEKALVDDPSGPGVGDLPSFFHRQVLFTEKIDGSNLGIWVRKEEDPLEISDETTISAEKAPIRGSWSIVSVQGRKQQLWPATEKNGQKRDLLKLPAYGNAGDLGELPLVMQDFAIRTAVKLGVDEIMIFGETLRAKVPSLSGQGNLKLVPCAVPSWHPFGYKLPKSDWRLHKLNSKTHELFSSVSMEMGMGRGASTPQTTPPGSPASESVAESTDGPSAQTPSSLPSNHEEMFHILRNSKAKEHSIFPPSAYFRGSLAEGIIKLHPIMMEKSRRDVEYLPQEEGLSLQPEPPQLFEGFFIVGEEVGTTTTATATTTTTHPHPTTAITTTTSTKDDRAEGIHAEKDHASTHRPLASGGFGCKWKSGFHETQKTPIDLDEIKTKLFISTSDDTTATTATDAYRVCELVAQVHEQTRSGRRTNTAEGSSSCPESIKVRKTKHPWDKLKGDIRTAFSHELSKRVALDSEPDKDIVSELVDAVFEELKTNQGELFNADEQSMLSLKVYIKNCVSSWIAKRAAKKK